MRLPTWGSSGLAEICTSHPEIPEQAQPGLRRARQGSIHSYLHSANVNGQDGGEKQHLKEEVRHQAHDGKETELLESEHSRDTTSTRASSTLEKPSPAHKHHLHSRRQGAAETRTVVLNLGVAKKGPCQELPPCPPGGSRVISNLYPDKGEGWVLSRNLLMP